MTFGLKEIGDYLVKLQIKSQGFSHKSPYSKDDIRHAGFLHALGVIQALIILNNILLAVQKNQIPDNLYQPLFGIKKEWVPQQFPTLKSFCMIALITEFHFGLEIFLKIILNNFVENTPQKFYQISKQTLEKTSIPDKDRKYAILMALAHMRNIYHSNGIHTNRSTPSLMVKHLKFEFIINEEPKCITDEHICVILDEVLSIMGEIVNSKKVLQIKKSLPVQFIPDENFP